MPKENERPIEILEFEFTQALETNDKESLIDLLKERPDLITFFCSVAIIRHFKPALYAVADELPDELKHFELIIKRMTALTGKEKQLALQAVEEPIFMHPLP